MGTSNNNFPERKQIPHTPPLHVNMSHAVFFVTLCAEDRPTAVLQDAHQPILDAARFYHAHGKWFLHLILIMPDHVHMLVQVPSSASLTTTLRNWKRYLARAYGIRFQRDMFETRMRDAAHYAEKWHYIIMNPVSRGIVAEYWLWPHSIAFDPRTGEERVHQRPADK